MRILLAEDDPILGDGLRAGLRQQGFAVDWVRDGLAAEREIRSTEFTAAVLDLGLPGRDGMDILQTVRAQGCKTPVLVLTARDAITDRVAGLDRGADDYVVKPVDLHELGARLRALIRRAHGQAETLLRVADVTLDPRTRMAHQQEKMIILSQREFDLLHALMRNAGRVLTRDQLEQQMYSWGYEVESNAIEVHIHHLRKKLGSDIIQTVRGVGYTMAHAATGG